jgi:hypothetical protein
MFHAMDEAPPDRGIVPIWIAICCLAVILALVLGVGLASNLVLRHLVQTAPIWFAVVLGFRRSSAAAWLALPSFLFWLFLMVLIWLYLLGISHVVSGHFSAIEIAMTIIVGTASALGLACFALSRSQLLIAMRTALFLAAAVAQVACFRISLLPSIARR